MPEPMTYYGPYRDIFNHRRPASRRLAMPVAHRAKQFAPFAALKGFDETIERICQKSAQTQTDP